MSPSSPRRSCVTIALILAAALVLPVAAAAKEESKIQIRLENLVGGTSRDESGAIKTRMADGSGGPMARLDLRVKRLIASTEYILMSDGVEIGRLTTNGNGSGKLRIDLVAENVDPRGTFLSVNDGVQDVLGAWLYGAAADDSRKTKIKETTRLAEDAAATPSGAVDARYMLLPNGMVRFKVSLRGLSPGDYDVCIDGVVEATLTTNSSGNAKVDFRTRPQVGKGKGKGNMGIGRGKPHNQKLALTTDPRDATIEVKVAGDTVALFSGPMRAQIGTLGACVASSTVTAMVLDGAADPGQSGATGDVTTGNEDSCDTIFEIDLAMLLPGDYELRVDGATIDTVTVTDDGSGTGAATLLYDENPDSGEMPLGFAFGSGSLVEIFDLNAAGVVLSATLP